MSGEAQPRARRPRSVTESLLSIALVLEVFLMFFVALTAFGLRAVEPLTALIGGVVFVVLLLAASRTLRFEWGVWFGWALQVALIATGFVLPVMFFIAAGFVGIWIYCFVKGRQIDRRNAGLA